jgi:hypothetical protein
MMENTIYIDENGVPVDASLIGREYEPLTNQQVEQPKSKVQNNLMAYRQQEERVHNFMTQTSPTGSLQDLSYVLQGYVYNETTRDWIKISDGLPDDIRLDFLQFITSDLSENVRMTNLDINQINGVMNATIEWVLDYLDIKADKDKLNEMKVVSAEWDIEEMAWKVKIEIKSIEKSLANIPDEQMMKIALIMVKAVFYTLLRSQAGVERQKVFGALNMNAEMNPQQPLPQKTHAWQFWK